MHPLLDDLDRLIREDPSRVPARLAEQPDLAQTVGLIDPVTASEHWAQLCASSAGTAGHWNAGPARVALETAPEVYGNLNGIPAEDKDAACRILLERMLADVEHLTAAAREQLGHVAAELRRAARAHLLSLFLDGAVPRAAVSFGDPDAARLVVVLAHGIVTDLDSLPEWARTARRIRSQVADGASVPHDAVAVIAWFGYDSGTHLTALGTSHATVGAARLAGLLAGIRHRAPGAHVALVAYSYSSTMAGELIEGGGGRLVDDLFSIASAGITAEAADAIEADLYAKVFRFHATESLDDGVAPLGRMSQHPIDPRSVPGAILYESDGGPVGGHQGIATVGHASHTPADKPDEPGYFDPRTESFLDLVATLTASL
ncbi:MAG: alpha/beta hydrolase family protein [Microbacterium sp.]|nr:alpha/beta hydrolase family protein [Microbacterium sp.]